MSSGCYTGIISTCTKTVLVLVEVAVILMDEDGMYRALRR